MRLFEFDHGRLPAIRLLYTKEISDGSRDICKTIRIRIDDLILVLVLGVIVASAVMVGAFDQLCLGLMRLIYNAG